MKYLLALLTVVWLSGFVTAKAFPGESKLVMADGTTKIFTPRHTVLIKQRERTPDILKAKDEEESDLDKPITKVFRRHPGSHIRSFRYV